MNKVKFWVLVPAAGVGKRMGAELPKQYLSLAGRSILEWTLQRLQLLEGIERFTLIVNPLDKHWQSLDLMSVVTAEGGDERFNSVMNGLASLKPEIDDNDWVLVHDAVRPCVALADMQNLLTSLADDPVGGLLASPVKDTLKYISTGNTVSATLDRSQYWLAATPQMFRYGLLCEALENALKNKLDITDEASAMEAMGHKVKIIEGRSDNIKVTHPEDLPLIEFLLQKDVAQQGFVLENTPKDNTHGI